MVTLKEEMEHVVKVVYEALSPLSLDKQLVVLLTGATAVAWEMKITPEELVPAMLIAYAKSKEAQERLAEEVERNGGELCN